MSRLAGILVIAAVAVAAPLHAQARAGRPDEVPAAKRPPVGMCRLWIDGVQASHQPAPTDCATAIRRRPPNARVIFGDDARQSTPDRDGEARVPRAEPSPRDAGRTPLPVPQLRPRIDPAQPQAKPQPPVIRTGPRKVRPDTASWSEAGGVGAA